MKAVGVLSTILLLVGFWCLAQAQEGRPVGPNPTAVGQAAVGQIPGTATNDAAGPGKVGEYFVSGASSSGTLHTSATVTISIASPAVISWTGNPFFLANATNNGCAGIVTFSTTGALPTGITAGTNYYVTCNAGFTANQFNISTSVANAIAGTAVNTSGTQSGTQTGSTDFVLTTSTQTDFGGMNLTAGDWDVSGVGFFLFASGTSVTGFSNVISSGTGGTGTRYTQQNSNFAAQIPGNASDRLPMSTGQVLLSSPSTVFCGMFATFTVSTVSGTGFCRARRVR